MKQDIEKIIKKNLPEKVDEKEAKFVDDPNNLLGEGYSIGFNQALSQINTSLIADKVLKVEIEAIEKLFEPIEDWIGEQVIEYRKQYNSGLQRVINLLSEHLSTNKENKNNGNK